MTKKFTSTKLGLKITIWVIISIVSALIAFFIVSNIARVAVKSYYSQEVYLDEQETSVCDALQKYITKNKISSENLEKLDGFADLQNQITFDLIYDNKIIYSSYYSMSSLVIIEDIDISYDESYMMDISLKDKDVKVRIIGFLGGNFYIIAMVFSFFMAFIVFLIVMFNLIRRHVAYIVQLEKEIRVLEGGNLQFPITIKGSDELASLAYNMEQMRKSIIQQLENEGKAKKANSELITAMSHDLRTPLTTQIGYLDIIALKKYKDEKQLFEYVQKTREKAYQIKNLSDKLFKYFLAFEDDEEFNAPKEHFSANELIGQILGEQIFFIEENGFTVEYNCLGEEVFIDTNAESLYRIFDNIFSNINKYACKETDVKISVAYNGQSIVISCVNDIPEVAPNVQSTEIGLKNSQKIASEIGGILQYHKTKTTFFLQLILPIE